MTKGKEMGGGGKGLLSKGFSIFGLIGRIIAMLPFLKILFAGFIGIVVLGLLTIFRKAFPKVWESIGNFITNKETWKTLFEGIANVVDTMIDGVKVIAGKIGDFIKDPTTWKMFFNAMEWVGDKIKDVANSLWDTFTDIGNWESVVTAIMEGWKWYKHGTKKEIMKRQQKQTFRTSMEEGDITEAIKAYGKYHGFDNEKVKKMFEDYNSASENRKMNMKLEWSQMMVKENTQLFDSYGKTVRENLKKFTYKDNIAKHKESAPGIGKTGKELDKERKERYENDKKITKEIIHKIWNYFTPSKVEASVGPQTIIPQTVISPVNVPKVQFGDIPTEYQALINEISEREGEDAALIAAIIKKESGGSGWQKAISPENATGLMQIMPKTAKGFGYTLEEMKSDPRKNIEAGIKHLKIARKELIKQLGREPTIPELYGGYNQGGLGYSEIIKASEWKMDLSGDRRYKINANVGKNFQLDPKTGISNEVASQFRLLHERGFEKIYEQTKLVSKNAEKIREAEKNKILAMNETTQPPFIEQPVPLPSSVTIASPSVANINNTTGGYSQESDFGKFIDTLSMGIMSNNLAMAFGGR